MNRHGTDKLWNHHYDADYEWHFESRRDEALRILEIGVGGYAHEDLGGESLRVWSDYFPNALITGLDIEEKKLPPIDRVTILRGDQNSTLFLEGINQTYGPFDIIIDDGSHRGEHITTSFTTLFPIMAKGGIYVIEDMGTSYYTAYGERDTSAIFLIARLIGGLHWQFWQSKVPDDVQRAVKSIHISKELAFIYKQ